MIDCAASSKAPNNRSSGLLARAKIDFKSCRLEASQNYRVRDMPETNGVWSLTLTHRAWNGLLHAHVHEWIFPVLHIDQSPSLHHVAASPGRAPSFALPNTYG